MEPWGELLVGLVILVGLVGVLVQVLPGGFLVLGAVLVWSIVTGGTTAWVVLAVAAGATLIAAVAKYVVAGRHLTRAGVPNSTLVWGGVAGIVGFFVIPVVGLVLGFVAGVYVAELFRTRKVDAAGGPGGDARSPSAIAWASTRAALVATGISILVELGGALVAAAAWVVGLVLT